MPDISGPTFFRFGRVLKAHGIRGELRISADVDSVEPYGKVDTLYLALKNQQPRPFSVEVLRWQAGATALVKLKSVNTRNESELLAGAEIFLDEKWLPALEEDEFYYHDVIGFDLVDLSRGPLGPVQDVLELPAQDVFQIFIDSVEVLVPIVDDWIEAVDFEAKRIEVDLPPGLIELFLEDKPRLKKEGESEATV